MNYMLMPLQRYVDFNGRSRRKEYWMWVLFVIIGYIAFTMLDLMLGFGTGRSYSDFSNGVNVGYSVNGGLLTMLFGLAIFIPGIAVSIRRLHDQDKSGWWLLLAFLPLIGAIVLIVFYCTEGTRGPNRFGPDPKSASPDEVFA